MRGKSNASLSNVLIVAIAVGLLTGSILVGTAHTISAGSVVNVLPAAGQTVTGTGINASSPNFHPLPQQAVPGQNYTIPVGASLSQIGGSPADPNNPDSNHTYLGALEYGIKALVHNVSATIYVPQDIPTAGEYFYDMLSIYDTKNTSTSQSFWGQDYDQLGIVANYKSYTTESYFPSNNVSDTWQIAWSDQATCGNDFQGKGSNGTLGTNWNVDQFTLNPGMYYNFSMSIAGGFWLVYTVNEFLNGPSGPQYTVWSLTTHPILAQASVSSFAEDEYVYSCGGTAGSYADYANYEESYYVAADSPSWNVYFSNNRADGYHGTGNWGVEYKHNHYSDPFSGAQGVSLKTPGAVYIENRFFGVNLTSSTGVPFLAGYPGRTVYFTGWFYNTAPGVTGCTSVVKCRIDSIGMNGLPSGATFSLTYSSLIFTGSHTHQNAFNGSITIPSTATGTWYYPKVVAINGTLNYQTTAVVPLDVLLVAPGGGCTVAGNVVETSTGPAAIQTLLPGNSVFGYNATTGAQSTETVLYNNATSVDSYVEIDNGLLTVTWTDQPVYMMNSTFTGWFTDPRNLTWSDMILDPATMGWVPVYNISAVYATGTTVYDLIVNGQHDFAVGANGASVFLGKIKI